MAKLLSDIVAIGDPPVISRIVNHEGKTVRVGNVQYGSYLPEPGEVVTVLIVSSLKGTVGTLGPWTAVAQVGKHPAVQVRVRVEDECGVTSLAEVKGAVEVGP